jgi:hypothetical protein
MTTALRPVEFTPPLTAPSWPYGLNGATTWIETVTADDARRWLPAGIQFRRRTHRDPGAWGIWGADWCASPDELDPEDDLKTGPPPEDDDPDPFTAQTAWAFDRLADCDNLSAFDRADVHERAEQTFAVSEPIAIETDFATRLLTVAPSPTAVDDLLGAVSHLEQAFAAHGAFGLIHARAGLLAVAEHLRLIVRDPATPGVLRTPSGQRWVFGGGYATVLGDNLVGTSQTYGWRDQIQTREAIQHDLNQFVVIAERSSVVGYESVIGAAVISP